MPEMRFEVRWPNGKEESCYSPSSVINEYLTSGESYPLADFLSITEQALNQASERVRQKYGYACSSAMDQLNRIQQTAKHFANESDATVTVLRIF